MSGNMTNTQSVISNAKNIPTFDGSDVGKWDTTVIRFQRLLKAHELQGVLTGDVTDAKKDAAVLSAMSTFLDGSALLLIKRADTSQEAWAILTDRYGKDKTTETYRMELRQKLTSRDPVTERSLRPVLVAREYTRDEYESLGGKFADLDLVLSTHDVMPASIRAVMAGQDIKVHEMSWADYKARVLRVEDSLNAQAAVLRAAKGGSSSAATDPTGILGVFATMGVDDRRGKCHHCGKPGHKVANCFKKHPHLRKGGRDGEAKTQANLTSTPDPQEALEVPPGFVFHTGVEAPADQL
eukprot:jgi/Mesvir1/2712/Mv26229-RA.1